MAAKLLHSLTDENPDLQKQIGCMTGIFQLFDRQQIITGRRIGGHSPKRLPSGNSHVYGGAFEAESNNIYHRPTAKERISTKNVYEKQRVSIESSRPSFSSSSRSSSFSSLDCNIRTNQPEPSSFDRVIFPEPTSRDHTMRQSSASPQHGRSSLDLRDVVKDSIYRDAWGLSVKTTSKDELSDRVMKFKDSPRQTLPMELKESIRVLAKLREAPWYHDESPERSRSSFESKNGSTLSVSKDAPRFSYDGRETTRSTPKQKELPRLSLDSGEGSMRSFNSDSKSHFLFRNSYRESGNSDNKVQGPSVVAKLMGLETLPDADAVTNNPIRLIKTSSDGDSDPFSRSSKPIVGPISSSSRNLWKEPASPRRKNGDLPMKPVPNSRFPIEPAPWKQLHGTRGSQKPVLRHVKTPAKPINSFPSVYSEIEKRLKDLEFTESGKDLRALKQILEAMQVKGLLDNTRKEGPDCDFATQRDQMPTHIQSQMSARLVNKQHTHSERAQSSRTFESPIVIMKPAKLVEKSGIPASSVIPMDRLSGSDKLRGGEYLNNRKILANNRTSKEQVLKTSVRDTCSADDKRTNHRTSKSAQSSIRSQNLPKENITSSLKNSSSVSPRLQQKKLELEKRSRPPISPESNKTRRQPIKHQTESSSPGGKRRPKSVRLQQNDDQYSEVSSETKNLSCQEDYTEVTSSELFYALNGNQSPSLKAAKYTVSSLVQQRFAPKLSEDGELAEFSSVAPEYPSPVSVLDDTMYTDDALSPVKRMSDVLKDEATVNNNPDREQQNIAGDLVSNTAINRKKLKNIENLVQKLRRVNSSHDEAHTDYIASLCENTNPDHRYISEILLASGLLLRDLNSSLSNFQLHPSGFPINPELFLVLEQTKASTLEKERFDFEKVVRMKSDKEKFHRKLIFDAVNEILVKKLTLMGANKLARRSLNAQQLLRDLCSEIENLQASKSNCVLEDEDDSLKRLLWEYVINSSESWTDFDSEISWLVLDVERMIFKDLVSEIVHGDAIRIKAGRRCRQLFS